MARLIAMAGCLLIAGAVSAVGGALLWVLDARRKVMTTWNA